MPNTEQIEITKQKLAETKQAIKALQEKKAPIAKAEEQKALGTIFADTNRNSKHASIMKKTRIYLLLAAFAAIGFGLGLAFNNLFTKSYAEERNTEALLPSENAFEVTATGTSRSADYEIVTIYGRKYIIFSNGDDIEVLNY